MYTVVYQVTLTPLIAGPDRVKMQELLDRTGYPLEVTVGQRKYGGPPPGWEGAVTGPSGQGHEVPYRLLSIIFKFHSDLHWSHSS